MAEVLGHHLHEEQAPRAAVVEVRDDGARALLVADANRAPLVTRVSRMVRVENDRRTRIGAGEPARRSRRHVAPNEKPVRVEGLQRLVLRDRQPFARDEVERETALGGQASERLNRVDDGRKREARERARHHETDGVPARAGELFRSPIGRVVVLARRALNARSRCDGHLRTVAQGERNARLVDPDDLR